MGRRNAHDALIAVGEVVPDEVLALVVIDLVDHEDNLVGVGSEDLQKHLILGSDLGAVHQKEDGVGIVKQREALLGNQLVEALKVQLHASAVGEIHGMAVEDPPFCYRVARDARRGVRDCPSLSYESVEQRRFADIGST